MTPRTRAAAAAAILAAALAAAPAAHAAPQSKLDADDWPANDLRAATFDVTPSQTTFTLDVDAAQNDIGDFVHAFIDTDRNGLADFAVSGSVGSGSAGVARLKLVTTPDSTATCQIAANGELLQAFDEQAPVVDDGTIRRYVVSFPTSLIGGAQSFDWAVYATTFSFIASAWDYMPDAANPDPARPNPNQFGNDVCDFNGDGTYGNEDVSPGGSEQGYVPMRLSDGFSYPDDAEQPPPGPGPGTTTGTTPPPAPPVVDPLTGYTVLDTSRRAAMPKVTGLPADTAKERVLRALGFADFDVKIVNVAKPPKGVGFTDVMAQEPKPGTQVSAGAGAPPRVVLEVYGGPKPVGRNDCADRIVRDLKGVEYTQAVALLKKAGCRPEYDFRLGSGDEGTVTKVTPKSGDRVELQVTVPKDPRRNDLFLAFRESPNQLSFDAADWKLTADRDQRNFLTVQVVDRAGRFVQRANVRFDTSDVGAPSDPSVAVTDLRGERSTSLLAPKAGTIDVVAWAVGANDLAVYGTAQLVLKARNDKPGTRFTTTSGRTLELGRTGRWSQVSAGTRAVAAQATAFSRFWSWLTALVGGSREIQSANAAGGSDQQKVARTSQAKLFPAVLAIGGKPVGQPSGIIGSAVGNVVAAGGGNVVSAGGANAVAAGGANVVSAGGANLGTIAAAGRLGVDPNKLLSDNGLGVVAPGGGNVLTIQGASIIGSAAGNLISDNGLGLQFAVGNGLIGAAGGNVVAPGGGNVVAPGGGN